MRLKLNNSRRCSVTLSENVKGEGTVVTTVQGSFEHGVGVYRRISLGSSYKEFSVVSGNSIPEEITSPPVADLSRYPVIDRLSNSIAKLKFSTNGATKIIDLDFRTRSTSWTETLIDYAEGTAAKFTHDILQAKLAANNPRDRNAYNFNSYNPSLMKNPNSWVADFNITAIPIKHVYDNFNGGGVAITRRHVLTTHHYTNHALQTEFKFLGSDNQIVTAQVIGRSHSTNPGLGNFNNVYNNSDRVVYTLAEDLPPTVTPMKVAYDWVAPETFTGNSSASRTPGIILNRFRKAYVAYVHYNKILRSGTFSSFLCYDPPAIQGYEVPFANRGPQVVSVNYGPRGLCIYDFSKIPEPLYDLADLAPPVVGGDSGSPYLVPLSTTELAVVGLATGYDQNEVNGAGMVFGHIAQKEVLDLMILSSDYVAGVSTGYTVTIAPDPTI